MGERRAGEQATTGDDLDQVARLLLDDATLVRAVASGRRRGHEACWRRVEVRWVDLKAGRHLQLTAYDDTQAHTSNHALGGAAEEAVRMLLAEPFAQWHVETTTDVHQAQVSRKGVVRLHTREREEHVSVDRGHDRDKRRLIPEDDPLLVALGISTADGRVKPSRRAKLRQVEEFVRLLDATVADALASGHLRHPTTDEPLRVADLGCGNAYLTFAAHRLLAGQPARGGRGLPVRLTGVDVKQQSADHNAGVAAELGIDADFTVGSIADAAVEPRPEVVLALHACDTATDEALARAVEWQAPVVLAAPCCHHDIAAQLRQAPTPAPWQLLTRHGILRERLADTLTDGLRAALLRRHGYRVDVVEFVGSEHTPRNTLLRAVRTGDRDSRDDTGEGADYDQLVDTWGVRPRLAALLEPGGA